MLASPLAFRGDRPILVAGLLAAGGALLAGAGEASAAAPACGSDASIPGRIVLCNDSVPDAVAMATVDCPYLGTCTGEAYCGSFGAPAGAYPLVLRRVWALLGPTDPGGQYDLEVYQENGVAAPGAQIAPQVANSYELAGNPAAFTQIDLSGVGNSYTIASGRFRVCLRKQFDAGSTLCLDTGQQAPESNWLFASTTACGQTGSWNEASAYFIMTNFILRPEVQTSTGGIVAPPPDGGVAAHPDAGPAAGRDAGPGADAAVADSGPGDGGGSAGTGAPVVSAVSPTSGSASSPTSIVVTGSGFVAGLTLTVGTTPAESVMLSGSSTIHAVVPAHLAPGTYDVVVENPDGQASVLTRAFTIPATMTSGSGGGCHCSDWSAAENSAPREALAAIALLLWPLARAVRRPRPARALARARS